MRFGQYNRIKPEFRVFLGRLNVHMNRLLRFPTEKEKPTSMMSEKFMHILKVAKIRRWAKHFLPPHVCRWTYQLIFITERRNKLKAESENQGSRGDAGIAEEKEKRGKSGNLNTCQRGLAG
jgi:hypothetical protein